MEVLEAQEEEGIVVVASSIHWFIFKAPTKLYSFWDQGDQKIWKKKFAQFFQKVAQTVSKLKKGQIIYDKSLFESPKYLHKATFETLKYLNHVLKLLI